MRKYRNLQNEKVEDKLSKLGALVSLATEDVLEAEQKARQAWERLEKIQREIEQLYITLDEPLISIKKT